MRGVIVCEGGGKREDGVEERRDLGVCEAPEGDEGVVFGTGKIASGVIIVVCHIQRMYVMWFEMAGKDGELDDAWNLEIAAAELRYALLHA
jgi:hypothetical protein